MGTPGEAPGDGTWGNGGTRQIGFPQGANHQLPGKGRGGWEVVVELEHLCWQTSSHFSPYGLYSHLKKNRLYWRKDFCEAQEVLASTGHKVIGNEYILSNSLHLFCMLM